MTRKQPRAASGARPARPHCSFRRQSRRRIATSPHLSLKQQDPTLQSLRSSRRRKLSQHALALSQLAASFSTTNGAGLETDSFFQAISALSSTSATSSIGSSFPHTSSSTEHHLLGRFAPLHNRRRQLATFPFRLHHQSTIASISDPISLSHLENTLQSSMKRHVQSDNSSLNNNNNPSRFPHAREMLTGAPRRQFHASARTLAPPTQSHEDNQVGLQYQRMSQREHILLRPEPYIGSSECVTDRIWVLSKPLVDGENGQIVDVDFNFIPGLYKIFDEILVNAADNVHRNKTSSSTATSMSYVHIDIDPISNHFSIENDGACIPVVIHPEEKMYVPELIFGHLLTSSNYNDKIARFTGGRHGFGAKLTNIFSKKFVITIGDEERGLIYHQEFSNNMETIHNALIIDIVNQTVSRTSPDANGKSHFESLPNWKNDTSIAPLVQKLLDKNGGQKKNFTRIEFFPDLQRFQVDRLTFLPTQQDIQDDLVAAKLNESVKKSSSSTVTAADQQKAELKRQRQKEQLSDVLTRSSTTNSHADYSDNEDDKIDYEIKLHKSAKLNTALQNDPFSCFPPFLLPLFERRILDVAAVMGSFDVNVQYNGKQLKTSSYQQYLDKCPSFPKPKKNAKSSTSTSTTTKTDSSDIDTDELIDEENQDKLTGNMVTTHLDKNWFIGVSQRPQTHNQTSGSQPLNQLSFVNSVATTRGGSHINYITDIIARYVCQFLNHPTRKKRYSLEQDVTIGQVKQFMCVFVSCFIHNPSFDSQTKDTLITHIKGPQTANPSRSAGTIQAPPIPETFLKQICSQTGLIQNLVLSLQQRQHKQLLRKLDTPSRKQQRPGGLAIEKLDDALWAGTERSDHCTLILTEGDSAKALAVSGLSVLGRERFGVYPLKGKLLNVRDASKSSIANNKELVEIMQILGLKLTKNDKGNLRYGSVLVMADQDHDGSHIKGLLVNALHILCPDLVRQQIHQVSSHKPLLSSSLSQQSGNKESNETISHDHAPYISNLPDNLQMNVDQHQFVRLFVTPIVKATYIGHDYPLLHIQRNEQYQKDLIAFQQEYGHLSPKQIDQLNATRKMLHQSQRNNDHTMKLTTGTKTKNSSSSASSASVASDEPDLILAPSQYSSTITFAKIPQHMHDNPQLVANTQHNPRAAKHFREFGSQRINDGITVRGKVISFYSQFAYKQWWESLPVTIQRKFKCKYYKGLGTSTSSEGKEYFNDLPSHIIDLLWHNRRDDQSLDLAFNKDWVDQRKTWVMENSHISPSDDYIRPYNQRGVHTQTKPAHTPAAANVSANTSQDQQQQQQQQSGGGAAAAQQHRIQSRFLASRYTTINDFIHNELVQFSVADTIRSLPSVLDGLKPSQRKITFAALSRPLNNEVRVSQFGAYVAQRLVYHHGEASLTAAIVNLAQEYPGTNNIPLLTGIGQFGTRHTGGKDHASARYIYTKIGPLTAHLFPVADHAVLPAQEEEGSSIEPVHMLPILPIMLLNGSSGIGTGFSTDIPAHNPIHVFQAVVQWLHGKPMRLIAPYNLGMTSQLTPLQIEKFDQNEQQMIGALPQIQDVDLSAEVVIPSIHAPWEIIPLKDTTNINKKFSLDNAYSYNAQLSIGQDNLSHIKPETLQYTLDNQPIMNSKVQQLQKKILQTDILNAVKKTTKQTTTTTTTTAASSTSTSSPSSSSATSSQDRIAQLQQQLEQLRSKRQVLSSLTDHETSQSSSSSSPSPSSSKQISASDLNEYLSRDDLSVTKWLSTGKYFLDANSKRTLHIVELPYGVATAAYKKYLLSLLPGQADVNDGIVIERIEERHTEQHVWFTIHCQASSVANLSHESIITGLKLTSNVSLTNMNAFDGENNLQGFADVRKPLAQYCTERLKCYERRRAVQITEKWRQLQLASNVSRFCQLIMSGELSLSNKTRKQLIDALEALDFTPYNDIYPAHTVTPNNNQGNDTQNSDVNDEGVENTQSRGGKSKKLNLLTASPQSLLEHMSDDDDDDDDDNSDEKNANANSQTTNNNNTTQRTHKEEQLFLHRYDYLLKIPIVSATKEKVAQLEKQMKLVQSQVASLVHTTARQMWLHELSDLQPLLEQYVMSRHKVAQEHPFQHHAAYKAALDGTTTLSFPVSNTNAATTSKKSSKTTTSTTKKATASKKETTSKKDTTAKKESAAKKETKKTTPAAKKTSAKSSTASKSAPRTAKKASFSTWNAYREGGNINMQIAQEYPEVPYSTPTQPLVVLSTPRVPQRTAVPSVVPYDEIDTYPQNVKF